MNPKYFIEEGLLWGVDGDIQTGQAIEHFQTLIDRSKICLHQHIWNKKWSLKVKHFIRRQATRVTISRCVNIMIRAVAWVDPLIKGIRVEIKSDRVQCTWTTCINRIPRLLKVLFIFHEKSEKLWNPGQQRKQPRYSSRHAFRIWNVMHTTWPLFEIRATREFGSRQQYGYVYVL